MPYEAGEVADIGHGTKITWATYDYAVLSVSGPKLSADAQEKTHSASANGWREFIAGLKDAGEISMELNFNPNKPMTVGAEGTLLVTFPIPSGGAAGATFSCSAILTGFEVNDSVAEVMTATTSWKLTGAPTWAASS